MKYRNNNGSASLEASLTIPVFILAMVYLYLVFQSVITDMIVYEAAAETVEYMAEYSYIDTCSLLVPELKFKEYVDDESRVSQYVKGGVGGIHFWGSTMLDEEGYVTLRLQYDTRFAGERKFSIRKRAYIGMKTQNHEDTSEDFEEYVYVTDYESVYHITKTCSHLKLTIHQASHAYAEKNGYHPCGFCGEKHEDIVYVTKEGDSYHSDMNCSGLKRTVHRKKKSEVQGLSACTRCGRE